MFLDTLTNTKNHPVAAAAAALWEALAAEGVMEFEVTIPAYQHSHLYERIGGELKLTRDGKPLGRWFVLGGVLFKADTTKL